MGKLTNKQKIRLRTRKSIIGTAEVPRLSVYRSNKYIYCQLIDDRNGVTLAEANSKTSKDGSNAESAKKIGMSIAEKAKSKNIEKVVFDRGGNLFHGRVKALADGAREGGLKF